MSNALAKEKVEKKPTKERRKKKAISLRSKRLIRTLNRSKSNEKKKNGRTNGRAASCLTMARTRTKIRSDRLKSMSVVRNELKKRTKIKSYTTRSEEQESE